MSSIKAIALAKVVGGGGGDVTVEALTATENKTYRAPSGKAYSPVNVNVPQSVGANIPVLLTVTTPPTKASYEQGEALDLTGIVVTATYADNTTANVTSGCTFSPADGATLITAGNQTITATYTMTDTSTGHNYTLTLTATTIVTVIAPSVTIVPFASGTDAQIAAMIDAAHAGLIDLQQDGGWNVGDVRTISIAEFTGGGNVVHSAQDIDIVISSFDEYMNSGNVLQFDFKDELASSNRMNETATNVGGYGESEMKTVTLPALVNAMPSWVQTRLIEFSALTSEGNNSSTIVNVTGNKLALRSIKEVFGDAGRSFDGEGNQVAYYNVGNDNRKKKRGHSGSLNGWASRSPAKNTGSFVYIDSSGYQDQSGANTGFGVAPFGLL